MELLRVNELVIPNKLVIANKLVIPSGARNPALGRKQGEIPRYARNDSSFPFSLGFTYG